MEYYSKMCIRDRLNPYELFPLDNGMQVAFAGAEYEAYL